MTVQSRAALQALATDPPLDHTSDGDALVRDIVDSVTWGWTQIGSDVVISSPTAYVDWSIPAAANELQIELAGVGHDDGSSRIINLGLSVDGGSTFPAVQPMSGSLSTSATVNSLCLLLMRDYITLGHRAHGGGSLSVDTGSSAAVPFRHASKPDAVRIIAAAGNLDAGTLRAFWR